MKRMSLKKFGVLLVVFLTWSALQIVVAKELVVGVSWSNFQEERWKRDEGAMRAALEARGGKYISADAQSSVEKQMADIESLMARGADALIILAQDKDAIMPAIIRAKQEGIPVVGYDRLIEAPGVFYLTFDNVEVGRMQARAVYNQKPKGRYVFIKGSPSDPNASLLHQGQLQVLQHAIDRGDIEVVGEQYTEGWLPELAQKNMEQILTANQNKVDAIVASNDGTAGGVVAALTAVGLEGLPVSGQDGDFAALNRVARGLQSVSVWKDARALGRAAANIALDLAEGKKPKKIKGSIKWSGGPKGFTMNAVLLPPIPITTHNIHIVLAENWIKKADLCKGALPSITACQ